MSCRDALPLETQLRIQAANIAASAMAGCGVPVQAAGNTFTSLAMAAFTFVTRGLDMAAIEAKAKPAVSAAGPKARMAFMNSAARDLLCEDQRQHADALKAMTVHDVVLSTQTTLLSIGITEEGLECIASELVGHGLRFGMTENELTIWIINGQQANNQSQAAQA